MGCLHGHHIVLVDLLCGILVLLGPGWPSAGGPRMDRRVVTRSEAVSCLASRLSSLSSEGTSDST